MFLELIKLFWNKIFISFRKKKTFIKNKNSVYSKQEILYSEIVQALEQ